ncbi:MAG: multidrug transporter [Legionellales bacterium RIFCSPHIGHO2_12_FULL_42_9]|nr:MAG: multidrug transporter [Legionellales bacterium RIFCSPHIGHO2_12_FULL_42_9]
MIPFIIALSFFMEGVDGTIINTAIPAMSRSLLVDPVDLKVALISYLLSLAIFIPISGWMADKFGAKKVFISALSIFTLSSLWCGFAHDINELVLARFVQGFGGALGLPVGRLILVRSFGRENLIATMSRVVTVGTLGPMLGPLIGGFITTHFTWHWIFWVNIPVGLFAITLAYFWLEEGELLPVPPLDKLGFILFGGALAGISFGLAALSETTVNSSIALSIILFAVILLIIYMMHSRRLAHPIVKTDLLSFRTFRVSVLGNLVSRLGFGGVPFLVPLLLQVGLLYSAEVSGMLLVPIAVGVLIGKPLFLPLLRIFGFKRFLITNTIFAGLSIWMLTSIDANTPIYVIAFLTGVYGFILTLQYSSMNSLAYADVLPEDLSAATSIMSTLQQFAQSFGVATSALFIRLFSGVFSGNLVLTPTVFHYTFFAVGFFTLLSTFVFLQLKPEDGQQLIL